MQTKPILLLLLSLSFSMVAAAQGAGPGHGIDHGKEMVKRSDTMHGSASASRASFDQQFLDTMSAHHQSGIEMAEMALSKSSHDEVRGLARMMIDDQKRDIAEMKQMKERWYAGRGEAINTQMIGMKESMKGMQSKVVRLRASQGDAFDNTFLTLMTRHHQDGIKMAQLALSRAQHDEIKVMAKKIIESQRKESDLMTHWKADWQLSRK